VNFDMAVSNFSTRLTLFFLLMTALLISNPPLFLKASPIEVTAVEELSIGDTIKEVNMATIEEHVRFLTGLGSRVTGYAGCDKATEYIYNKFLEYNLSDVHVQVYNNTSPIDYGATLTVLSPENKTIKVYPLWPNLVQTSPVINGITGRLIYAADGDMSSLNGKRVEGSIALMDFNSRDRWVNLALLGAKAVVFLEPSVPVGSYNAEKKYLEIPLYFPRLYVPRDDGEYLLSLLDNREVIVNIKSNMQYERRKAKNVIGFVYGTDPDYRAEAIAVLAYYDSYSVVPSLAPGAKEALGISVLLDLARFLSKHPTKRSVMFVALSGHNQFVEGARWFAEEYFYGESWWTMGKMVKLAISLDFSTESDTLGIPIAGWTYGMPGGWGNFFRALGSHVLNDFLPKMNEAWDRLYKRSYEVAGFYIVTEGQYRISPAKYSLDTDPIYALNGPGIGYVTSHTLDLTYGTPFDTADRLNFENLRPQVEFTFASIYSLLNNISVKLFDWEADALRAGGVPVRSGQSPERKAFSFLRLIGQVVEYDYRSGWYKPVPNALVYLSFSSVWVPSAAEASLPRRTIGPFRNRIIVAADENGVFDVPGIIGGRAEFTFKPTWTAEAYVVNSTGGILYATDFGIYGEATYSHNIIFSTVNIGSLENPRPIVVFPCGSIALFNLMDPETIKPSYAGAEAATSRGVLYHLEIKEKISHSEPISFGFVHNGREAIAFVQPNTLVEILLHDASDPKYPMAVLINASIAEPEGVGYAVKGVGDLVYLFNTPLKVAEDLNYLNGHRINTSLSYGIASERSQEFYSKAQTYLNRAKSDLDSLEYDAFHANVLKTWSFERKTYSDLRLLLDDVMNSTILILIALLPFVFLAERLFFQVVKGGNRLILIFLCLIVFMALFNFLHPGFAVSANSLMVVVSIMVTVLSIPTVTILIARSMSVAKQIREEMIGRHAISISRFGAISIALSLGVRQMRKRPLRTALTLFTLILITTALVALTSTSFSVAISVPTTEVPTYYDGVYVRTRAVTDFLSDDDVQFIKTAYVNESLVSARAAWFSMSVRDPSWGERIIGPRGEEYMIFALMGLEPEESEVTGLDKIILEPGGRWFLASDYFSCIIPEKAAQKLGVTIGESVTFIGVKLTVIGIYDSSKVNSLTDMDTLRITPTDFRPTAEKVKIRLPSDMVMIIPYKLALDIGGETYSISVKPYDLDRTNDIGQHLSQVLPKFRISAGLNRNIAEFWHIGAMSVTGWQFVIVPLIIGCLSVLNLMLGSIYARVGEISIFSSVGLSPLHVSGVFLAEAVTHAMLAGVIGYFVGMAFSKIIFSAGLMLEGLTPNFTSISVMLSVLICVSATIVSSIYPFVKAAKIVTPSLERKWKIPTKPIGDIWEIPMPFFVKDAKESKGVLAFLKEYLQHYASETSVSIPFRIHDLSYREESQRKILEITLSLPPYDKEISQKVWISAIQAEDRWDLAVRLQKLTGMTTPWRESNKSFLSRIREQMLLWRGLRSEERERYIGQRI